MSFLPRGPVRFKDGGGGPETSRDLVDLVARAEKTRGIRDDEKARSAARLGAIAVVPFAIGAWLWVAGVAVAATAAVGIAVVARAYHPAAPGAVPTVVASTPAASSISPNGQMAAMVDAGTSDDDGPDVAPVAPAVTTSPWSAPAPAPARPSSRSAATDPSASASSSPDDALVQETALIEQARGLLASDPAQALKVLGRHRAEFPQGQLGVERELLTVDALRRLGRTQEARRRGESLLKRVRGTIYQARVEGLLAELP